MHRVATHVFHLTPAGTTHVCTNARAGGELASDRYTLAGSSDEEPADGERCAAAGFPKGNLQVCI